MDPRLFFLYSYLVLGLIFVLFNKRIGAFFYKLTLLFTDRMNLNDFFLFKVDEKNRDSFFFLTRVFSVAFGLTFVAFVLFNLSKF